ncbi:Mss4-like protein [Mycena vitilis]|nr:Mss4-like protein [Mycena vitilis]
MTSATDITFLPVPWPENAELEIHTGGCHCKRIRFEFEYPDIYTMPVINCNCSICVDRGLLDVFTAEHKFRFTTGSTEDLIEYTFGAGVIRHRFCKTCGTTIGAAVPQRGYVAVNTRTIDGIDFERLQLRPMDGRAQAPPAKEEEEA